MSEDDGAKWSELKPAGDWGGIVVMGCLEELKTGKGHYMAMFHDDGRFFAKGGKRGKPAVFTLYKTFSEDGGLTWSKPESIYCAVGRTLVRAGDYSVARWQTTLRVVARKQSAQKCVCDFFQ